MAAQTVMAGASLLAITPTAAGVVVGCPGCGAQMVFPLDEEPLLEHASIECPVFRTLVDARQRFLDAKEVRG